MRVNITNKAKEYIKKKGDNVTVRLIPIGGG